MNPSNAIGRHVHVNSQVIDEDTSLPWSGAGGGAELVWFDMDVFTDPTAPRFGTTGDAILYDSEDNELSDLPASMGFEILSDPTKIEFTEPGIWSINYMMQFEMDDTGWIKIGVHASTGNTTSMVVPAFISTGSLKVDCTVTQIISNSSNLVLPNRINLVAAKAGTFTDDLWEPAMNYCFCQVVRLA
jgi:hypothetical protein